MNNPYLLSQNPAMHVHKPEPYFSFDTKASRNMTANKQVGELSTEQLYNAVFDSAFHPMFIADENETLVRFNEKLAEMFKYDPNELADFGAKQLFLNDNDGFSGFLHSRKEKGIARAEVTGINKYGRKFPIRISSVVYETERGEIRSLNTVVNISNDLSARWNVTD